MKDQKFTALEGFIFVAIALSVLSLVLPIPVGLIWASVFALMFGSFATSFVARIPRGIMQKKEDPYCMSCKHALERRDLYTIFSYIVNRGKCRFCGSAIPKAIFYTETAVTISYVLCYLLYGFSLDYVLNSFLCFFAIIAGALWLNNRYVSYQIFGIIALLLVVVTSSSEMHGIFGDFGKQE